MNAGTSPRAEWARDLQSRIGDALDGIEALRQMSRSDDWTAGLGNIERLRSAIEWTVDRLKADLTEALNVATDTRS